MGVHKTSKGLDLPLEGEPEQRIDPVATPRRVALLADDYAGMKPTMRVRAGGEVRRGQLLFEDKKIPGVRHTSPASGKIVAIHRGARRAFQSVVIELDQAERAGGGDSVSFDAHSGAPPGALSRQQVKDLLLESGSWTALRTRPFSRTANPADVPHSIFVTALDTQPLAPSADVALAGKEVHFERGLRVLARLTDGAVYVCKGPGSAIPVPREPPFREEVFAGPHPSGTVGLHIHVLDPVDANKLVWHLNYQDTAAIGKLFGDGTLEVERVISIAGPSVRRPRLLRTRLGVGIDDLISGEISDAEQRVISGSVLSGRAAAGDIFGYLGRYHHQVSVIREGRERQFLGWLWPGAGKYSTVNTFLAKLRPGKRFGFSTTSNGSRRAMVPIGMYERVMPMDIPPTFLLRALLSGDVERAQEMGCLELDEEDLALCSFVCPGKAEYGPLLRDVLTRIEKEG